MRITTGKYNDQISFGICFIWSWDYSLVIDVGPFWAQISIFKGK